MSSPRALLREALKARGITNHQLRKLSGVDCSASSISRKLSGLQALTADEACRIGNALGVKVHGASKLRALEERHGVTISWPAERERGAA